MTRSTDQRPSLVPPPVVEVRGQIGADLAAYAQAVVTHVLEGLGRPVNGTRIRVLRHPDPARERPVTASVLVDHGHGHVHAHVTAEHPREAVDLLADRLRRRVLDARRGRARPAPPASPRAARIARHDTVQAVPIPVEEAAAIVVDLDEDVHLFLERTTGRPAVVYRAGPTGVRVAFRDGPARVAVPDHVSCSPGPARRLPLDHAVDHLALSGLPFLFFADPRGRARVLHRDASGAVVLVDVLGAVGETDRPGNSGPPEHPMGDPEP